MLHLSQLDLLAPITTLGSVTSLHETIWKVDPENVLKKRNSACTAKA